MRILHAGKQFLAKPHGASVLLLLVTSVIIVAVLIAYALPFFWYLDFHPINGAFQTFNPTRRILSGTFPGDGFQPYLGVGVAWFHASVTLLLGGDFAASQFMSRFLPPVIVLAYIALVLYLSGMRFGPALLLLWFAFLVVVATLLRAELQPWGLALPDLFQELLEPGNSTLAVRLMLPLLTVVAILALYGLIPEEVVGKSRFRASLFGAVTGLQPFWCNDYGIASCLCLTIAYWLAASPAPHRNFANFAHWSVAFIAAFCAALWIAGGSEWLRYNFQGVAGDQFWYFGLSSEGRAYRLTDIPVPRWGWIYAVACAWILWRAAHRPGVQARWILFYVSATPFIAGFITTMGGVPGHRYFLPVRVLLPFVLGAAVMDVYADGTTVKSARAAARLGGNRRGEPPTLAPYIFLIIATCMLWGLPLFDAFRLHHTKREGYFVEPALGGYMQEFYAGLLGLGHELGAATAGVVPQSRIFSTFASALDVVAGSRDAAGQDYIIHALGDRQRAEYLQAFESAHPVLATAISDRFTVWGELQYFGNWWFFRDLLLTYRPRYETASHIVYERTDTQLVPRAVPCEMRGESGNAAVITAGPTGRHVANDPTFVDVLLTYSVSRSVSAPGGLDAAYRFRVSIEQLGNPDGNVRSYGAPPSATDWPVLAKDFGNGALFRLRVDPASDWKLEVRGCKAAVFGTANELMRGRYFVTAPANLDAPGFTRGIAVSAKPATSPGEAGLVVRNARELSEVIPGAEIILASGSRRVSRVDGNKVWFEGPPLNPTVDGFPAVVKIPQHPQRIGEASLTLRAADLTDRNWRNGIRIETTPLDFSFFFVTTAYPDGLKEGDELDFAAGGRRTVVRLAENGPYTEVLVTGGPLDPVRDGFPHPIRVHRDSASVVK